MLSNQCYHWLIVSWLILTNGFSKVSNANSIFRFGFDFGLRLDENSFQSSFHLGDSEESKTNSTSDNLTTATDAPAISETPFLTDVWSKQEAQLNATANDKLQATRAAVTQLNQEISTVVGRSDFIAAKVKLMTRYLNKANAVTATAVGSDAAATNRFLILQDYVQLVDDLRVPPTHEQGAERSLEYLLMKLSLEKHHLIELQTQILVEVLQALETWQSYVKTQSVDVVVE